MAFYIQSVHSRLYLEVKGKPAEGESAPVITSEYHGRKIQQWKYMNGKIVNRLNNLVLDVDGDNLITSERSEKPSQKWNFEEGFTIANDTGLVLDIKGGSKDPGTEVIVFKKHGGENQQFRIVPMNKIK